jgi:hypothetical protein
LIHTCVYNYDILDRLADVRKDGVLITYYDYDDNGNRIGGVYDDQDRMLKYGGIVTTTVPMGSCRRRLGRVELLNISMMCWEI